MPCVPIQEVDNPANKLHDVIEGGDEDDDPAGDGSKIHIRNSQLSSLNITQVCYGP